MVYQTLVLILPLLLLHNKISKKFNSFDGESVQCDNIIKENDLLAEPVNDLIMSEMLSPIEPEPYLALVELKDKIGRFSGLLNGVKSYMPANIHYSINKFCGMATLIQDICSFMSLDLIPLPEEKPVADNTLDMYQRKQGILNEFKKYVEPGAQKTLDTLLKMNDVLNQLRELMDTSTAAIEIDKEHQVIDNKKVWRIMEVISPLLDETKQKELDSLIKKLKLFEAINSIDLSSSNSLSKEEQMHMMFNIIKPMLSKDQQESLDNFIKIAEMMGQSQKFDFDENEEDEAIKDKKIFNGEAE